MPQAKRYISPPTREKLKVFQKDLERGIKLMKGRSGVSRLDQKALQPGYDQALHHLERALVWVEEMNFLIEAENL